MAISNVFVTVGTTQFEKLISCVTSEEVLCVLEKKGCKKLILQVGQGKIIQDSKKKGITIQSFSLKPSISEDISNADLVISHAGAGSCLSVLSAQKPLIVVVNDDLMDNHQEELASKLADEGYLFMSKCGNLLQVLDTFDSKALKIFTPGNPAVFANYVDNLMGFSN